MSFEICHDNMIERGLSDYTCILVLNITKAGFQHKPRIFFLFCDLSIINFLWRFWQYSRIFWHKKLDPMGGIHETRKKKLIPLWRPVAFMRHENQKIET